MKDYYQILGVDKKAPKEDIKKAFRNLAHKYHPDKKGGDDAKFKEINEAYSVLSDDSKRANYDQFGSAGANGGGYGYGSSSGSGSSGFEGFDFSQFTQGGNSGGQGFEFDFGDMFGDIFGGTTRRQAKRGRDISIDLELSFEDSVFGVERTILLNKVSKCDTCSGTGALKGSEMMTCEKCNGKGTVREVKRTFFGQFESTATCAVCDGLGKIPKNKCHVCHGKGIYKKESEIKVKVPAGIDNGEMIRLTGGGEAVAGGQAGDLYIKIYVKKHPVFTREGENLVMNLNIKLSDAILGAEYNISSLDGEIKLKIPEGISHGEVLRIKNKGIPVSKHHRGDVLVKVLLVIPKKLTREARKSVEDLRNEGY
ncbi:MAG: molecular chaperone DnaJ [Minisyncoccia bacterium]